MASADYNPFSAEVLRDPFPALAELRTECPVHRFDGFDPPFLTVTRLDDVTSILRDNDTWTARYGQSPLHKVSGCLFTDPPEHTMYRKLVQQGFTPRVVASMEDEITALADELVTAMIEDGGPADLHDAVACPLPVLVIAKILGVPTDRIVEFKEWSDRRVEGMASSDPRAGAEALAAMQQLFLEEIDKRRTSPGRDDMIDGLVHAEVDGRRLNDDELLVILEQLLVGGNETTTSLITNLFWRLLDDRALWEQLAADRSSDAVAIEESLRFDPPVLGLFRTAAQETELHDVAIPDRTKVMTSYAAANRDPGHFEQPDVFRLDRDPAELRKHLSFGLGHHFCPGAHLSRLEARIVLRQLADRLPTLRLDGDPERISPFLLWGRRTLPIDW
ncbi:MAG: cytochrome P450 [Actinomycetota bacterium]